MDPPSRITNKQVADIFYEVADILDLKSVKFKPAAYRKAAHEIETLGEDINGISERGKLEDIPGVGSNLAGKIEEILEKAPLGKNPSNMAQFGRFVFSYKMIEETEKLQTGLGGELWITDMNNNLAQRGEKVIAQPIDGEWLTTGDPLNYLKTTFRFALERADLSKDMVDYIKGLNIL